MKYDNKRAFEKHLENASPHHFSSLYTIIGKEYAECKEAVDCLISALLTGEKQPNLCLRVCDGQESQVEKLLIDLKSISFLTPKRVFWIQSLDKLKKNVWDLLEKYLTSLQKSDHLILTASSLSKATTFYKKAEKEGIILEIPELKPWEKEKRLVEWVSQQASSMRKVMPHQVCQFFVKQIGLDQTLLQRELDKLFCYVGERKEITLQDIGAICTQGNIDTIWQLGEAIFRCETAEAVRIGHLLLSEGALLPLLRQIRSQFQTEYQVCTLLAQGKHASDIAQEFPYMKGHILNHHIQLAQSYGLTRFRRGLIFIDTTEGQAKNSLASEHLLLELLILKLTDKAIEFI